MWGHWIDIGLQDVVLAAIMNFSIGTDTSMIPHPQQPPNMSSAVGHVDEDGSTMQLDQSDRATPTALDAICENFVGQCSSLATLIDAISTHASTCTKPYTMQSWTHTGHVLSVDLECVTKHSLKWSSSSTLPSDIIEYHGWCWVTWHLAWHIYSTNALAISAALVSCQNVSIREVWWNLEPHVKTSISSLCMVPGLRSLPCRLMALYRSWRMHDIIAEQTAITQTILP